ncbi:MAG: 16S rRNA (guanine(527)-N(7))-methyltransferase RsmG [Bryobacteraceae bacterium]
MFTDLLRAKLAGIFGLSDSQAERLRQHYELLTRWNIVLNLTSIRTLEEAVERHYCESIFAASFLPAGPASIADLGSGAGFPGIPIAIVRPDFDVVLIESHQRKAAFLKEATRDLSNVSVIAARSESLERAFDWVVSRAVRCADIAGELTRLGRNAELLSGEVRPGDGFEWEPPIPIPWGASRYLWIGWGRHSACGGLPGRLPV